MKLFKFTASIIQEDDTDLTNIFACYDFQFKF